MHVHTTKNISLTTKNISLHLLSIAINSIWYNNKVDSGIIYNNKLCTDSILLSCDNNDQAARKVEKIEISVETLTFYFSRLKLCSFKIQDHSKWQVVEFVLTSALTSSNWRRVQWHLKNRGDLELLRKRNFLLKFFIEICTSINSEICRKL